MKGIPWDDVVARLESWRADPESVSDNQINPPTGSSISAALRWVEEYGRRSSALPETVSPSGDGSVCFQRWSDPSLTVVIEFRPDGAIELDAINGLEVRVSVDSAADGGIPDADDWSYAEGVG